MAEENETKSEQGAQQSVPQSPSDTQPVARQLEGQQPTELQQKDKQPYCHAPQQVSKKAEWAHAFASFILVIITFFILRVYSGQLEQMRKSTQAATDAANAAKASVDQIERNAHLDQRAWVTIETAQVVNALTLDETPEVKLRLFNSGKTPALKMHVSGMIYIGTAANIEPRDKEPLGRGSEAVIGPNSHFETTFTMRFPITDQAELDRVKQETAYLYIIGIITYVDMFEKPHRTDFCFRLNGKSMTGDKLMWWAETGNTAD